VAGDSHLVGEAVMSRDSRRRKIGGGKKTGVDQAVVGKPDENGPVQHPLQRPGKNNVGSERIAREDAKDQWRKRGAYPSSPGGHGPIITSKGAGAAYSASSRSDAPTTDGATGPATAQFAQKFAQ
jgi:hypothetical protein